MTAGLFWSVWGIAIVVYAAIGILGLRWDLHRPPLETVLFWCVYVLTVACVVALGVLAGC